MSSADEWFKRWGKMMPFGPWSYADVDEMMKEMEKEFMALTDIENQLPKELVRERRAEDGSVSREIGPIVYGYSMTIGPDGKPVIREFGNVRRTPRKEWKEAISDTREPLVDVVEGAKEVRVLAELPGARKQDIELTVEGKSLAISAETAARKYRKELELPYAVELEGSRSTFNNGILEVTLPKRKGRSPATRIKVD
ncbi:MAG TPA: archaeal heat shock protein Hsp20 [Nitrososphaerales archaeon]|nr:archaeal heat shock protein Hsp20 [Nitrososphaerales archaeon]